MALISNASNLLTKGINEAYGLATTGIKKGSLSAVADKYRRDLEKAKSVSGGLYDDRKASESGSNDNSGSSNMFPIAPLSSGSKSSGSGNSGNGNGNGSSNSKIIESIGKGWDDAEDAIKSAGKSLSSSKNYISNLGKVRDKYIDALDKYKNRTDEAIAGNKQLIEKNQKSDLDSLAGDTRKSMDNANLMLGIKGASGGSASRAASRAIAQAAGKERASVLTGYGDQMSEQNQAAENAAEEYKVKRAAAYEWEESARKQAIEDYNDQREALERIKSKKSGWKESDIKAESDKNLSKLLSSLSSISASGKAFRDDLAAKYSEYGGLADELNVASVSVDTPAALDTPEFSEDVDLNTDENSDDWFDPDKTGKKVIKRYDSSGRAVYEDADGNEVYDDGTPAD